MQQLNLIPPPPFAPVWPSSGLALAALGLMLEGCTIDHPDFERKTGSWRLAAAINLLRAAGWPVESYDVPDTLNDGRPRQVARYFLPAEIIAASHEIRNAPEAPASDLQAAPMPSHTEAETIAPRADLGACHA